MHLVFLRLNFFFRDYQVASDQKECTGRQTGLLDRLVINYLIIFYTHVYARTLSHTCDGHEIEETFALQKIRDPHRLVSPQFRWYYGRTFRL